MVLRLLQLASSALPVGTYNYSEGLEYLVGKGAISTPESLESWLRQELAFGVIRLETAVMLRSYNCLVARDLCQLNYWNKWLSASKESVELREQSWQMGSTLMRLLGDIPIANQDENLPTWQQVISGLNKPHNYGIAFGIGVAYWQISIEEAILGYLQSWATNLIGVGVKLIPLGQTTGQQLLFKLDSQISATAQEIIALKDEDLCSCGWGLSLASMAHETQYTRLFRS
ncbi:MAG: urease accessory protein UreF [Spirulinaceae cyanobacterium]